MYIYPFPCAAQHFQRCLRQAEHNAAIELESQWIPLYTIKSDSQRNSTWVLLKVTVRLHTYVTKTINILNSQG